MNRLSHQQRGAALLIALVFLVILTLLSITAMRSSTMELRMSANEQAHRIGFDSAQSAIDTAMASNKLIVRNPGDIFCFGFGSAPSCPGSASNIDLTAGAGVGEDNFVRATLQAIGPCPRSVASSSRGSSSIRTSGSGTTGNCAYFTVESIYDATAKRGGRVETQQGYVKILAS